MAAFPPLGQGRRSHRLVSGLARRSFALWPVHSLTRLLGLLYQGLRVFHCFHTRLGCYRLERKLPGGFNLSTLPLESCAFPRRTLTTKAEPRLRDVNRDSGTATANKRWLR